MEKATIVKISDEESHYLYELNLLDKTETDFPRAVAAHYPNLKLVVYTLGKNGSVVLDVASGTLYASGKPTDVEVVSTVGAGDCFCATFVATYLNGGSIPLLSKPPPNAAASSSLTAKLFHLMFNV